MYYLTVDQHRIVVERLAQLAEAGARGPYHSADPEYTSLMVSFLLHNLSAAYSLIGLIKSFGVEWFPVTVGYAIVRPMFEIDVTAHYISQLPAERARQYIEFGSILRFSKMQAIIKHRNSNDPSWKQGMDALWEYEYAKKEQNLTEEYRKVRSKFIKSSKGREIPFHNWAGVTLKDMAVAVKHQEAYDIFYSDLSSFTHADVSLADRFLKIQDSGPKWSMRASESDVGFVFRYAATFLDCFLTMFGEQFAMWKANEVRDCWHLDDGI
jgi:hypothetical protein